MSWYFYAIDWGFEMDNTYPRTIPLVNSLEGISEKNNLLFAFIGIAQLGGMCFVVSETQLDDDSDCHS
jgi:hypothetical protein